MKICCHVFRARPRRVCARWCSGEGRALFLTSAPKLLPPRVAKNIFYITHTLCGCVTLNGKRALLPASQVLVNQFKTKDFSVLPHGQIARNKPMASPGGAHRRVPRRPARAARAAHCVLSRAVRAGKRCRHPPSDPTCSRQCNPSFCSTAAATYRKRKNLIVL